jgi:hypothetical protein
MAFTLFRNLTLPKSMAHSPSWMANNPSACQECICNLWKLKIHYRVHKSPPLLRVLSQMTPALALSSRFLKIRFNIILLYTPRSSKPSTSFRFSALPCTCVTFSPVQCTSHDSPPHPFSIITLVKSGEEYKLWSYSPSSRVRLPITSLLLGPNVLLGTLLSNTLSL